MKYEFQQEHFGNYPKHSTKKQLLHRIAEQYFHEVDKYDTMVCTVKSPLSGQPIPADIEEDRMIFRHANNVRSRLKRQYCLTDSEFQEAIKLYHKRWAT